VGLRELAAIRAFTTEEHRVGTADRTAGTD
jgi:hypothetical protein